MEGGQIGHREGETGQGGKGQGGYGRGGFGGNGIHQILSLPVATAPSLFSPQSGTSSRTGASSRKPILGWRLREGRG